MPKEKYNDKNKLPKEQYDPLRILNVANTFNTAANRCEEQRPTGRNTFEMPLIPGIVNRVFSCELYIKAIIAKNGIVSEGHNLCELFAQLPNNIQGAVIQKLLYSPEIFNKKLKTVSDAFVEWRYIYEYEKAQLDLAFLQTLQAALKNVAENSILHNT